MARLRGNKTLRFLDRYAGIPVVAALGLRRHAPRPPLGAGSRIGLMKSVAIGDMVLLAGVVADVRATYPGATLVIISGEDNAGVGDLLAAPGDERVLVSPHQPWQSIRRIRAAKLDALVDFGAWPRFDAVLSAMSGAAFTAGFRTAEQGRHHAYDTTVEYSSSVHEVMNNRALVRCIGVESTSEPRIAAPQVPLAVAPPSGPYMVIQPWAGGFMREAREWPGERWVDLARYATMRGWSTVIAGSHGDMPRSLMLYDRLRNEGIEATDAAGRYTVPELATVLFGARVVVSVNTGVMHLAAAVGAKTVGLQGPTSSRRWGPLGRHARAVDSRTPGCGYLNLGWEYSGRRLDCMEGVELRDVVAAISELVP